MGCSGSGFVCTLAPVWGGGGGLGVCVSVSLSVCLSVCALNLKSVE